MSAAGTRPDWDSLYESAAGQEGHFTTGQAEAAGFSPSLLNHHLRAGRIRRVRRGVYRLVHFPAGDHEELVVAWLWSDQTAVVSHESALALHDLSGLMPEKLHLTLPADWRRRRLRVPKGVVLHFADIESSDRTWFGPVPTTRPARTLRDCASSGLSPELLAEAAQEALDRGFVVRSEVAVVEAVLADFGGLE